MATEQIEMKCALMGVDCKCDRFIEMAKSRWSAWEISVEWERALLGLQEGEKEFLGLAACELWRRWCPERPSVEMVDDWLCEGYAWSARKEPAKAVAVWWKAWQALQLRFTPEIRDLQDAGKRLFSGMSQCLTNWGADFRLEALNASVEDPQCGEIGIRLVTELFRLLPDEKENLHHLGDLAMIYFNLGREAEAEQCCERLIEEHPDRSIGYVTLSDGLLRNADALPPEPSKVQRAIQILEKALALPVKDAEDFDVRARLQDACRLMAQHRP